MAKQRILTNLDLALNEIQNVKLEILSADPVVITQARIWYNSTTKTLKFFNNSGVQTIVDSSIVKFYTTNFFSAVAITVLGTQHNFNRIPNIKIYDPTGQTIFAKNNINFTTFDITITFNRIQSGTLILT